MIFTSILILILAMALHSKYITPILFTRIGAIVFIYSGALSLNALYIQSIGSGIGIYSGLFHVTTVSQLLDSFIFFIGSLILFAWPTLEGRNAAADRYSPKAGLSTPSVTEVHTPTGGTVGTVPAQPFDSQEEQRPAAEYSLIVIFSSFGASLLVSSADLISMYLSIELQSFGVYILSTLYRDSESSCNAGLKYFLLGGLSSCFILFGSALLYINSGTTNLDNIYVICSISEIKNFPVVMYMYQPYYFNLSLVIMFTGFLFKVSAAPFHF